MKKNVKGSTLVWSLVVIMVVMVTVASALAISFAHYNRSLINNSQRQAYISAKNITKNITEEVLANNQKYLDLVPELKGGEVRNIEVSEFPNSMGIVNFIELTTVLKKEDGIDKYILTISTGVTYDGQSDIVNSDLKKVNKAADWQLLKYYRGDNLENINVANANEMINTTSTIFNQINNPANKSNEKTKNFINDEYADEVQKLEEAIGPTSARPNWVISDDYFRLLYFYGFYDGSWPKFDNKQSLVPIKGDYYIQPYFAPGAYTKFILFANEKNNPVKKDWLAPLVFYEGHWYYSESKFSVLSLEGNSAEIQAENWKKLEAWIATAQKCD